MKSPVFLGLVSLYIRAAAAAAADIANPTPTTGIGPREVNAALADAQRRARGLSNSYEPEGEVVEGRYSGGGALRPTDRIKMGDGSLKSLKDIDAELKKKKLQKESEAIDEIAPALALKLGLAAGTAAAGIKIGQKAIDKVKSMTQKRKEAEEPYKKLLNQETEVEGETIDEKSAAWTRKSGQNSEGGLNEKGRKSYEKENPGSDLKAPSKVKGNPRRKSFCARMKGMKNKLTSAKTANDPDSRINKSLRKWDC